MPVASTVTYFNRNTVNINDSQTIAATVGATSLEDKAGYAVKIASGLAVLCDSQGERAFGVVTYGAGAGEQATIAISGRVQVSAGDTISMGDLVTPQNDGQVETAASGDYPLGIALEDAAANELFYILIDRSSVIS